MFRHNWKYIAIFQVFLVGCVDVPPGTRPITDNPEIIRVAEFVSDLVGAPERCRNWHQVGVYSAYDEAEFVSITGESSRDLYGYCYYQPNDPSYDSLIVIPGRADSVTIGHEIYHHISYCMFGAGLEKYQSGDNDHEHPNWDLIHSSLEQAICHNRIVPSPDPLQETILDTSEEVDCGRY